MTKDYDRDWDDFDSGGDWEDLDPDQDFQSNQSDERYLDDEKDSDHLKDREDLIFSRADKYSDYDQASSALTEEERDQLQGQKEGEADYNQEEADQKDAGVSAKQVGTYIYRFIGFILFALVLLSNYMVFAGIGVPNSRADIAETYLNLVTPASFTYSIWILIFIGVAASLLAKYIHPSDQVFLIEYKKVRPFNWLWMVLNIIWVFTLANEQLGVASLVALLYTLVIGLLSNRVKAKDGLKNKFFTIRIPVGLHFGWMIIATFTTFTYYLVDLGLDGTGFQGVVWAMIAMVLMVLLCLYFYRQDRNLAIFLPSLWLLVGVLVQQAPSSSFAYASTPVFILSVLFFIGGIALAAITIFQGYKK